MEKYDQEDLIAFVDAIRGASVAIAARDPSFYMVSLNGGLPLFDVLNIVDRGVDAEQAVYFPGSSKIRNCREVLTRCFENFFLEKQDETDNPRTLISLDEVVSGDSVERLVNAYNSASRKVARSVLGGGHGQRKQVETEAGHLRELFPLYVFGIREVRDQGTKMSRAYLNRVRSGEVREFPAPKIITMDDPDYKTVEFNAPSSNGFSGQGYFPTIKELITTEVYNSFLQDVAAYIGVDPEKVSPDRSRVISDCKRYSRKPEYS